MSLTKPLSTLYISESYERLLQIDPTTNTNVLDGTGSSVSFSSSLITNFATEVSRSAANSGFSALGSTNWNDLTNIPTNLISSSLQLSGIPTSSITNFNTEVSRSVALFGFGGGVSDYLSLTNIPNGIISSSGQTSSLGLGKTDTVEFGTLALSNNLGVAGNVLINGTLTAREYIISSSIFHVTQSYSSGSTISGDTQDDTHLFTGSLKLTGSLIVNGVDLTTGSSTDISFNGNRTVKRSGIPNVNVGTTTNVLDFINAYFFPFIPSTLSISGASTYEIGSSQNITITINITENDETSITNGQLNDITNTILLKSFTTDDSYIDTGVTTNKSYKAQMDTDNNGSPTTVYSNTINASFIYPYFYGMSSNGSLSGTTLYGALTKVISGEGTKTLNFNDSDKYMYLITPSTWNDVSLIYDPNSFVVTDSFTQSTVSITSTGLSSNYTQNFKMYRSNTLTTTNGNFTFHF